VPNIRPYLGSKMQKASSGLSYTKDVENRLKILTENKLGLNSNRPRLRMNCYEKTRNTTEQYL
jgi:hypothetical protein